jgi:hypothetical protein
MSHEDLNLPIELSPVPHVYVIISGLIAIGLPAIMWITATAQRKTLPTQFLVVAPTAFALMILYKKSMTVRLSEEGISKGLPVLGTLIPYVSIARISKELLLERGSPSAFVVSERDSERRIIIRLGAFDRAELARMMAALAQWAPQAQIDEAATYVQLQKR